MSTIVAVPRAAKLRARAGFSLAAFMSASCAAGSSGIACSLVAGCGLEASCTLAPVAGFTTKNGSLVSALMGLASTVPSGPVIFRRVLLSNLPKSQISRGTSTSSSFRLMLDSPVATLCRSSLLRDITLPLRLVEPALSSGFAVYSITPAAEPTLTASTFLRPLILSATFFALVTLALLLVTEDSPNGAYAVTGYSLSSSLAMDVLKTEWPVSTMPITRVPTSTARPVETVRLGERREFASASLPVCPRSTDPIIRTSGSRIHGVSRNTANA